MKEHTGVDRPSDLRAAPTKKSYWKSDLNWGWYNQVRRIQFNETLYTQHRTWEEAYRMHDHRVRRFFEDKPDCRFLEMEITDGDGWDVLCPFLGIDPPGVPFPHCNRHGCK